MALTVTNLVGFGGGGASAFLYDILLENGVTPTAVWDAADLRSYSGSGQTVTDITGGGFNFQLGSSGSADATDPTFTGTAGVPNEGTYFLWGSAGAQQLSGPSNFTFDDNWHKDGARFTILGVFFTIAGTQTRTLYHFRTAANGGDGGYLRVSTAGAAVSITVSVDNSGGEDGLAGGGGTASAPNFFAGSYDEPGLTAIVVANGTSTTNAGLTASTATNANTSVMLLGINAASGARVLENTERWYCGAAINGTALSATKLNDIYLALKGRRFPSMG